MKNSQEPVISSTRPYLLRALHEWMLDNDLTPQLVVDAGPTDVQVPRQFVEEGRIVLNVSTGAVRNLLMGNDVVEFSARFSGTPFQISVPIRSVLAIVARENGAGMSFPPEESLQDDPQAPVAPSDEPGDTPPEPPPGGARKSSARRNHLKVVK